MIDLFFKNSWKYRNKFSNSGLLEFYPSIESFDLNLGILIIEIMTERVANQLIVHVFMEA